MEKVALPADLQGFTFGAKEIVVPSESKVTQTTNMEVQNIFRPPSVIASSESPAMLPGLSREAEELLQVE